MLGTERLQKEPGLAEPLFVASVEGSRSALDRNHETALGALSGLMVVYSTRKDWDRLEPVLIESRDISLFRYGSHDPVSAGANESVGTFLLSRDKFARAVLYIVDCLSFLRKNEPDQRRRYARATSRRVAQLAGGISPS